MTDYGIEGRTGQRKTYQRQSESQREEKRRSGSLVGAAETAKSLLKGASCSKKASAKWDCRTGKGGLSTKK